LQAASANGDVAAFEALLSAGADVAELDRYGKNAPNLKCMNAVLSTLDTWSVFCSRKLCFLSVLGHLLKISLQ
jgi:ankyrin repeat protein